MHFRNNGVFSLFTEKRRRNQYVGKISALVYFHSQTQNSFETLIYKSSNIWDLLILNNINGQRFEISPDSSELLDHGTPKNIKFDFKI